MGVRVLTWHQISRLPVDVWSELIAISKSWLRCMWHFCCNVVLTFNDFACLFMMILLCRVSYAVSGCWVVSTAPQCMHTWVGYTAAPLQTRPAGAFYMLGAWEFMCSACSALAPISTTVSWKPVLRFLLQVVLLGPRSVPKTATRVLVVGGSCQVLSMSDCSIAAAPAITWTYSFVIPWAWVVLPETLLHLSNLWIGNPRPVSLIRWILHTCPSGCTGLLSLQKCLDHRNAVVVSNTVCSRDNPVPSLSWLLWYNVQQLAFATRLRQAT